MRSMALAAAVVVLLGIGVSAHHSYPNFSRDQAATVAGAIENIVYKNPHVVFTLRAADSTLYTVEWQGASWLYQHYECSGNPVTRDTLKVGDVITVVGAPAKDPARHELVSIKDVRRPRDQWHWRSDYF